jgi:hypothetical protein
MKTALILGVEVFGGVEFLHPVEPEFESDPWTIAVRLSYSRLMYDKCMIFFGRGSALWCCLALGCCVAKLLSRLVQICSVLYSSLLHPPTLRFHCFGGCWDRTQDRCDLAVRRSNLSATSHPHILFTSNDA